MGFICSSTLQSRYPIYSSSAYKPEYVVTVGGKSFNVTLNRPDYFHNNYTVRG